MGNDVMFSLPNPEDSMPPRRRNPADMIRPTVVVPPAVVAPPAKALMGIVLRQVGPDGCDVPGSEVFAGLTQEPAVMREILAVLEKHAKFDSKTGRPVSCVLPQGKQAVERYADATLALDALLADEVPPPVDSERTMDVKACEAERAAYKAQQAEEAPEEEDGLDFLSQVAM